MAIPEIARIRSDGFREISATGPEAMRYIFYKAGCKDGSPLVGLLSHEWKEESRLERWTGACKSRKTDLVYFKTFSDIKSERIREFGSTTLSYIKMAEERNDPSYFFLAIEQEPALADARLGLFQHEVRNRNCKEAKRHLEIFLILSPGFHANSELKKVWTRHCIENETSASPLQQG